MTLETVDKVTLIVAEETDMTTVNSQSRFDELGVDSLDFLCIVNRVRNEVGPVHDSMIRSIEKVIDLAAAVGISPQALATK